MWILTNNQKISTNDNLYHIFNVYGYADTEEIKILKYIWKKILFNIYHIWYVIYYLWTWVQFNLDIPKKKQF